MGVLATAILAWPDAQKLRGNEWSKCGQYLALLLSLIFQLGIALATITATWYGPVSIVVPTSSSAQLLFNMVMFGVILGLESFSKDMRVGAYVVVLAAILLPIVGPQVQENQDILELLSKTGSIVWSSILLASLAISFVGLVISNAARKKQTTPSQQNSHYMFVFNLVAQTSGAVVGTTVAKMFVLVEGAALAVSVVLWLVSSIILVYATILQATTVSQGKFVPLSVGTKIAVNAITGIIIWEDWRAVTSWVGYVCVFLFLMLGNYLLMENVDLFGVTNQEYGTAATLEKLQSVIFDPKDLHKKDSMSENDDDVEMQRLEEAEVTSPTTSTAVEQSLAATDDALPSDSPRLLLKSNTSTSEAADWISEKGDDLGSEVARSSSTAEAEDYIDAKQAAMPTSTGNGTTTPHTVTKPSKSTEAAASTSMKPSTASGLWRKAYHVKKKKKSQHKEEANQGDFDPTTPSGVWRKAYKVQN